MIKSKRKGAVWEFGQPYISKGVVYPIFTTEAKSKFKENIEGLKEQLFYRLKKHYSDFGFTSKYYPRLSTGTREDLINFQVERDCACFTFENQFNHIINDHNLDGIYEKIIAFNTSSDLIEILDENILAPRIKGSDKNARIEYPLPDNINEFPKYVRTWIKGEMFRRVMGIMGLEMYIIEDNGSIKTDSGNIFIQDGSVIGEGFSGFELGKATFPISKIVDYIGHPEYAPNSTAN